MSNHQKGYFRDSNILRAVQSYEMLDTEQIRLLYFLGLKYGRRIAQKRLLSLCKRGRLKRGRESMDHPYYYYIGKRCLQIEHKLGTNWVRLWIEHRLKSWESIHSFEYEQDYGILRADGLVAIKNKMTGAFRFCFVEFDNAMSGNQFDKVEKYNRLFEKQPVAWWVKLTDRFPAIIVVTTSLARVQVIREKIKQENVNGLEFHVYELSQIRGECEDGNQA